MKELIAVGERTTKVFAKAGHDNATSAMYKNKQRFRLDIQCSAAVYNFNNIFSNEHLYRAGQSMNSLPSQILERWLQYYFDSSLIMTEKQIDRIYKRIDKYKKALAADKKFWGGEYHDGGGIRYVIPEQYIKIQDYKGGLRYLNWFVKNFPDDSGFPIFLFEWTFILFKCGKIKDATEKAYRTFFSNTYLFDKFLGKELLEFDKSENSSWELASLAEEFPYKHTDDEYIEFAKWLEEILTSRAFLDKANEFIEVTQQVKNEPFGPKRNKLLEKSYKIKYG